MTAKTSNHGNVMIAGASSGIGRELALELAARSQEIVLVARRTDRLDELRMKLLARHPALKVVVSGADLSEEHEVDSLLQKVAAEAGPIDVLVNCAGLGYSPLIDRADCANATGPSYQCSCGGATDF